MGTYVYKTTAAEVTLDNGEIATVAVFAYKLSGWDNGPAARRSGANRADSLRDTRREWTILGYLNKDTNLIEVDLSSGAKKIGKLGSFRDTWFDFKVAEMAKPVAAKGKVRLTRTRRIAEDIKVEEMLDNKTGIWTETRRRIVRHFHEGEDNAQV
jgi:hypothetical protein